MSESDGKMRDAQKANSKPISKENAAKASTVRKLLVIALAIIVGTLLGLLV
ncbi:hypothetical protein [Jiella mangrovi]|uniref:Uncharacterized protein n=1 Tax=Jiella mangrovi TaxID=2821407 RepID=A0ABS4BEK2_9HYPH|nr:hypothetical protein [Jiella mangrovi]MBP0615183.1 hypothetical protein [Jiella mangrovi]